MVNEHEEKIRETIRKQLEEVASMHSVDMCYNSLNFFPERESKNAGTINALDNAYKEAIREWPSEYKHILSEEYERVRNKLKEGCI